MLPLQIYGKINIGFRLADASRQYVLSVVVINTGKCFNSIRSTMTSPADYATGSHPSRDRHGTSCLAPDAMAFLDKMITAYGWPAEPCHHLVIDDMMPLYFITIHLEEDQIDQTGHYIWDIM